jgi:hypothetical protein
MVADNAVRRHTRPKHRTVSAPNTAYGRVGDAYVTTTGRATGSDLDTLLAIATGGGHGARMLGPRVGKVIVSIASDLTPEMLDHGG